MAVHPPTGPIPPNDGSNIFRRGYRPPAKPVPPADDVRTPAPPPEPDEVIHLDDDDILFSAPPQPADDPDASLSAVMLVEDAPDDEPPAAALLADTPLPVVGRVTPAEPPDESATLGHPPAPPSAADSSIFSGGSPAGVGEAWLDASAAGIRHDVPAEPPPTTFTHASELFASLRAGDPDGGWGDSAEPTGRVSENELREAFSSSDPDFHLDIPGDSRKPGSLPDIDFGDQPLEVEDVDRPRARVSLDHTEALAEDASDADDAGSSIFDQLPAVDASALNEGENVDFNLPLDPAHASSMSGQFTSAISGHPYEAAADLFGDDADAELGPADLTDDRAPAIAAAVAAGALGGVGGAAPAAPRSKSGPHEPASKERPAAKAPPKRPRRDEDEPDEDEDRPTRPAKKRSTVGGILAGLVTGLVLGAGGFAGVYMSGLIPNEKKAPPQANVTAPPAADPQLTAKVEQLTGDLKAASERADEAGKAIEFARKEAGMKQKSLDETKLALNTALEDIKDAKAQAAAFKKAAEDAKNELDGAKTLAATAEKERDAAKVAQAAATQEAADNAKRVIDAEKKLKAADDTLAAVVKELKANKLLDDKDDASKLPEAVQKLAAVAAGGDAKKAAETVLAAQKERDAARAALTKAEKEADAKIKTAVDDATKDLKQQAADALAAKGKVEDELVLARLAAKADVKAAVEEVKKDLKKQVDDATAAKTAAAKAEADAVKAKADAEKLVADARKEADAKIKTAVDDATKDLKQQAVDATAAAKKAQTDAATAVKKAEDDLATAKRSAKADAEAAAKAKLDDATARAITAEKALETKLKALEAEFAAKLADARTGVAKLTPAEMESSEKATRTYADGLTAYYAGRYSDAEGLFAAATQGQPADARFWYYLGLARGRSGTAGADEAMKKGAEMEARNKPGVKAIDAALERLSFADKQLVNKYRP